MLEYILTIQLTQPYIVLASFIPLVVLGGSYLLSHYSSTQYCDKTLLSWVIVNNKRAYGKSVFSGKILPTIAWILFCIALSGPRVNVNELSLEKTKKYNNASVIILDLSKSMLVDDVYPDRATKAKLVIKSILSNSENILFSLVVFGNNAHVVIPLTYDKSVILDVLDSIKPNMLPVEGSNYQAGINKALEQLSQADVDNKSVLIFTDGDFEVSKDKVNLNNIRMHIFGLGTLAGKPIPKKNGGWVSFNNKSIISKLNITNLKTLAERYNGSYKTVTVDLKDNEYNFPGSATTNLSSKTVIIWGNIYAWFLVPAIFIFLFSTLALKETSTRVNFLLLLCASFFTINPSESHASESFIESADKAYHNKNFIKSESLYLNVEGFIGLMGQANSVYRQKNYSKALYLYTKALLSTKNDKDRAVALFNLANTYYILGDYTQSKTLYNDSLKYNPTLKRSKVNLSYAIAIEDKVKKELAILNGNKSMNRKGIKSGSGPSSADIEQGVDVGNSKVTLSDSDANQNFLYSTPLDDKQIRKLIERGIEYSKISSTKFDAVESNTQWDFDFTTIDMIELLVKQEKLDNYNLWKRLFEIESGFPAPVETPHIYPGVNPW